jgi:L-seryl-tRNA(Ser) seleniumtransferase
MEDLGSGTLVNMQARGLPAEPTVQDALRAGMDVVTFSGDKLLGGPQAGIICGRAELIARMKKNPLYRALRVDKLTLAALEATLRLYRDETLAFERVPALKILTLPAEELRKRARQLAKKLSTLPGVSAEAVETQGYAGGGSLPDDALSDWAIAVRVEGLSADALHAALRTGDPPVVGRISEGVLLLHLRTMKREHFPMVEAALAHTVP